MNRKVQQRNKTTDFSSGSDNEESYSLIEIEEVVNRRPRKDIKSTTENQRERHVYGSNDQLLQENKQTSGERNKDVKTQDISVPKPSKERQPSTLTEDLLRKTLHETEITKQTSERNKDVKTQDISLPKPSKELQSAFTEDQVKKISQKASDQLHETEIAGKRKIEKETQDISEPKHSKERHRRNAFTEDVIRKPRSKSKSHRSYKYSKDVQKEEIERVIYKTSQKSPKQRKKHDTEMAETKPKLSEHRDEKWSRENKNIRHETRDAETASMDSSFVNNSRIKPGQKSKIYDGDATEDKTRLSADEFSRQRVRSAEMEKRRRLYTADKESNEMESKLSDYDSHYNYKINPQRRNRTEKYREDVEQRSLRADDAFARWRNNVTGKKNVDLTDKNKNIFASKGISQDLKSQSDSVEEFNMYKAHSDLVRRQQFETAWRHCSCKCSKCRLCKYSIPTENRFESHEELSRFNNVRQRKDVSANEEILIQSYDLSQEDNFSNSSWQVLMEAIYDILTNSPLHNALWMLIKSFFNLGLATAKLILLWNFTSSLPSRQSQISDSDIDENF